MTPKEKKAARRADNAALAQAAGFPKVESNIMNGKELRAWDRKQKLEARKARSRARKARRRALGKKRPPNRQKRMQKAKKEGHRLWSLAVRTRDGWTCLGCGKTDVRIGGTERLQAHHWLFRKSHSVRLALEVANGATLCYGCHIGRIHHDGDGDFMLQLADKMILIVGMPKIAEMRQIGRNLTPVVLEEIEGMVSALPPAAGKDRKDKEA